MVQNHILIFKHNSMLTQDTSTYMETWEQKRCICEEHIETDMHTNLYIRKIIKTSPARKIASKIHISWPYSFKLIIFQRPLFFKDISLTYLTFQKIMCSMQGQSP